MELADNQKLAHVDWITLNKAQNLLNNASSCKDLDEEVEQLEKNLTKISDTHAKILRITLFLKQWWNKNVVKARKTQAKKRKWQSTASNAAKLKQARNLFYKIIQKAKQEYWQSFFEGEEINGGMRAKESVKN